MGSRAGALLPHSVVMASAGIRSNDDDVFMDVLADPTLLDPAAYEPWVRLRLARPDWRRTHELTFELDGRQASGLRLADRVAARVGAQAASIVGLLTVAEPALRTALGPGRRLDALTFDSEERVLTLGLSDHTDDDGCERYIESTPDGRTYTVVDDPYDWRTEPRPRLPRRLYPLLRELRAALEASLPPVGASF